MAICIMQVIVEKAERSDIPDIDKKKSVLNFSKLTIIAIQLCSSLIDCELLLVRFLLFS
jgi:hypothetical protein